MKKLTSKLISTVIALSFAVNPSIYKVMAEDNSNIEIKFNLGDSNLYINSEVVNVTAPYSAGQGTTMVPLRVITEAFGAKVDWNANEKKVTIKYEDSEIIMYINSKEAIVNGNTYSLTESPVINNSTTMVPLRFISEKFGAKVSYDETTKGITVEKSSNESNKENTEENINVNDLLNVSDNAYIGDSNFKWYMKNSPSFSLTERNFNGSNLTYTDDKGLNEIVIYIQTDIPKDYSIDEAIANEKSYTANQTLVSQKQSKKDGADYFEISYKTKEESIYTKLYLKDNILYDFNAYISNESDKQNTDLTLDLFNSITLGYKNDGSISDLSSINEAGLRKFEQTKFKIAMNLPASWTQVDDVSDKINEFIFRDKQNYDDDNNPPSILIRMFSHEEGLSLSQWAKRDADSAKAIYNPKYYTQKLTSGKIGSYDYSGYDEDLEFPNGKKFKTSSYYIYGKNYRYQIFTILSEEDYKNKQKHDEVINAVNSFRFEEPDKEEIGLLSEDFKDLESSEIKTKQIVIKKAKLKADIPVSWEHQEDDVYFDYELGLQFSFYTIDGKYNSIDFLARSIEYMSNNVIEKKNNVRIAGKQAAYIKYSNVEDDETIISEQYLLNNDDGIVVISANYLDLYNGARTQRLIKSVIDSIAAN